MYHLKGSEVSEWPPALLLDEIWLRARRQLVYALEGRGLWPTSPVQTAFIDAQRQLGGRLKDKLLTSALTPDAYRYLHSETAFGISNRSLRNKLPLSLAFGYEICAGFQGLRGASAAEASSETAALFNLGISLFDLLLDTAPGQFDDFSRFFNEETLSGLAAGSRLPEGSNKEESASREAHILLGIIQSFFDRLASERSSSDSHAAYERLIDLLSEAYRAEVASRAPDASSHTAKAKSTLPFQIIWEIAQLLPPNREHLPHASSQAAELANVFWLTDDLSDIVGDFQAESLNFLLSEARCDCGVEGDKDRILRALLAGGYIEDAVASVCRSLESFLSDPLVNASIQRDSHFAEVILGYVRSWIE